MDADSAATAAAVLVGVFASVTLVVAAATLWASRTSSAAADEGTAA